LPLSPPIDQRQGAIRTEIESRDSGNGRLPGVLVRFASDSPLEGDGFELAVPRKSDIGLGEVIISRAREERVVAGPQDFLLAAPLFRVCPFSLRGWRLFVRVVPVLFSTALITSLSARAQKFLYAAYSTSTKSANAATVPLVGFAVSRYLPATRHSRAPRKRPANGWPTTPADLGRVAPGCRKRVGATAVPQLDLSCSACHSIEPGAQLVLVGVAPPRSFSARRASAFCR